MSFMWRKHRKIWFQQLPRLCGDCKAQKTGKGSEKIWEIDIQNMNLNAGLVCTLMWGMQTPLGTGNTLPVLFALGNDTNVAH